MLEPSELVVRKSLGQIIVNAEFVTCGLWLIQKEFERSEI